MPESNTGSANLPNFRAFAGGTAKVAISKIFSQVDFSVEGNILRIISPIKVPSGSSSSISATRSVVNGSPSAASMLTIFFLKSDKFLGYRLCSPTYHPMSSIICSPIGDNDFEFNSSSKGLIPKSNCS